MHSNMCPSEWVGARQAMSECISLLLQLGMLFLSQGGKINCKYGERIDPDLTDIDIVGKAERQ